MEKFLFTFKLSKGSIIIGWTKFALSVVIALIILIGALFSSSLQGSLEKVFKSEGTTSQLKYYGYLSVAFLLSIVYAALSFVLVVGSINRHRGKVFSFMVIDAAFTLLLFFAIYQTSLNIFVLAVTIVQLYFFYTVFCFWRQLDKQFKERLENQEARNRRQNPQAKLNVPIEFEEPSDDIL